jgi:hypothetical protein
MEARQGLDRYRRRLIDERLRALWKALIEHFTTQAKDDLARAEERHRGQNEPIGSSSCLGGVNPDDITR